MAVEDYAPQNPDKVYTDVLSIARQACYKDYSTLWKCKKCRNQFENQCRPTWVKHFDRQYASKKRLQRLLDDNESRRGPLSSTALHFQTATGGSVEKDLTTCI